MRAGELHAARRLLPVRRRRHRACLAHGRHRGGAGSLTPNRIRQHFADTAIAWRTVSKLLEHFFAERLDHRSVAGDRPCLSNDDRVRRRDAVFHDLASDIGWSRKHFSRRFAAEIGLAPKTVARMMRFSDRLPPRLP